MSDLSGRTALVTGASRGIGRQVAESLSRAGARVWGLARSEDDLADLSRHHGVEPLRVDLRDETATWLALDDMTDVMGGAPDIVVNAAGTFGIAACDKESVASFDAQIAVNLRGPFLVVRALLPAMLERRSGLIVNIGSVAGRRAFTGNAAYSASKFGLRGFHEVLLEELKGSGVRASLVEPAATDTPLWDPLEPDSDPNLPDRADMLAASEVADAVLFIATRSDTVSIPVLRVERG
ncbi:MAG: SDR family NAD(P)-dependent oxidoreductase [Gemmatimonadetes bacterium]|nr:SDR family NAD(P)-dependent oxidoreductase [Gemmatimonadota bacterium]MDA1104173.1 SDR family NAD(P)-dependent oxidoreductase [Gemmatimonadota bacterium]